MLLVLLSMLLKILMSSNDNHIINSIILNYETLFKFTKNNNKYKN